MRSNGIVIYGDCSGVVWGVSVLCIYPSARYQPLAPKLVEDPNWKISTEAKPKLTFYFCPQRERVGLFDF